MRLFENHTTELRARQVLTEQIAKRTGGRLDEILLLQKENGGWNIVASALTPQSFSVRQVQQMQNALREGGIENAHLIVRSLVSQDVSANGRVYLTDNEVAEKEEASKQATHLETAREAIRTALQQHQGLELVEVERSQTDEQITFTATVRAPTAVTPEEVQTAQSTLNETFGEEVKLVVRSITTQDADATGFLYRPTDTVDPEIESLRERIRPIVARRLPGEILTLSITKEANNYRARATIQAPTPTPTETAQKLEADLQANIDPRIRLSVQTNLVID